MGKKYTIDCIITGIKYNSGGDKLEKLRKNQEECTIQKVPVFKAYKLKTVAGRGGGLHM
jgi:hypothetical protein